MTAYKASAEHNPVIIDHALFQSAKQLPHSQERDLQEHERRTERRKGESREDLNLRRLFGREHQTEAQLLGLSYQAREKRWGEWRPAGDWAGDREGDKHTARRVRRQNVAGV